MKRTRRSKHIKCDSIFSFEHNFKYKPAEISTVDPVLQAKKRKKKAKENEIQEPTERVRPSFNVRRDIKSHCLDNEPVLKYGESRRPYDPPRYLPPKTKKYLKERAKAKKMYEEDLNFCRHIFEATQMPKTSEKGKVLQINIPSPEQSEAKVKPRSLSPTISALVPILPNKKKLELRKPKSGIIINETRKIVDYDSFDLVYRRMPRPGFEKELRKKKLEDIHEEEKKDLEAIMEKELMEFVMDEENEIEGAEDKLLTEATTRQIGEENEGELTKVFRKKVEQLSKSTSFQATDLGYESQSEEEIKLTPVGQMTQKFRRGSEIERFDIPPPKIKRGTLESHSFTKLNQTTLKDFFYGTIIGTMHQGAEHFPDHIRDCQGLTMPVTAYCYALLKHPCTWDGKDIDQIIESANSMYADSTKNFSRPRHRGPVIGVEDLPRYCYLFDKKIRFRISEPQVTGVIKSDQRNVYNLTKGMNIFFSKHKAGIFQTNGVNIAIWRDKYFYFFDGKPRTRDLYPDPSGVALMANFYDVDAVISVLLDRCMLGNWPFVILAIEAFSIYDKHEVEDRDSGLHISDRETYKILNERNAVVQGSLDLTDKCFEFTRNKQALAIAVTALVYSKISPPSSWFTKTVDKIMLIGNQLYLECVDHKPTAELRLDQLPAEFTLGPYSVEIYVKPNIYGDYICKKGKCLLELCLEKFFEKYSMAIVVLGKDIVAIWKQRGVYYCFDPYSRNMQGRVDRNGVACVSMHTDIDSLTWMLSKNYCENDIVFYIHALVVCRITRELPMLCAIPLNVTMNGIPIEDLKKSTKKKGQKLAVKRPVQVPPDANLSIYPPPMDIGENETIVQVDSNVGSLAMSKLPALQHVPHLKAAPGNEHIVDLDSPSLSDTQIQPRRIEEEDDDEIKVDIDSYQLTMEELMGTAKPEKGEGDQMKTADALQQPADITAATTAAPAGDQTEEAVMVEDFYMAANASTEMGPSLIMRNATSVNLSAGLSGFMHNPEVLPPTDISKSLGRKKRLFERTGDGQTFIGYGSEPDVTQSEELNKPNNFFVLPDDSQLVRGRSNMADLEGQDGDMEFLAPFVCIMATAVANKFALSSWSPDVVEYVLQCGQKLYKASKFRYDQVSRLDIPKVSLGSTNFNIVVEYLFDTFLKDTILELALDRILFLRSDRGIFVTPTYSCAVFHRHHLYYLYDGYGNNEVGLSEGTANTGAACLVRFKDLKSLVHRIIYNKMIREGNEHIQFSRFVISKVIVTPLNPPKPLSDEDIEKGEDDEEWIDIGEGDEVDELEDQTKDEEDNEKQTKAKVEVGWKWFKRIGTIRGSKSLKGRGVGETEIKPDHFACICACLMLIEIPIDKWDSIRVDYCLDQGRNIYNHADDLCATEKRIIKNILVRNHFFDIIVKKIQIINYSQNKDLNTGIDTLFERRYSYFIVQLVGSCNVIYKGNKCYYLFDPYAIDRRGRPIEEGQAGWIRYKTLNQLKRRLRKEAFKTGGLYSFYTFEVTSIKKAPKSVLIAQKIHQYKIEKPKKKEKLAKPFYEEVYWLNMTPIPWSRMTAKTPSGTQRGCPDYMWHNWDTEYAGDLYSLLGNIHQASTSFPLQSRGKQTLCNIVMAIGMIQIYDLKAWSSAVVDSVLVNGDNYCRECIKDIKEANYELSIDDLKTECEIFPYTFKIKISNVVDGTMFLLRARSFNLFKALRYFFDDYDRRFGIITVSKYNGKRQLGFGKTRDLEYFMFDCESVGVPMFPDGQAVAYILRTTTFNRLLHVLTLTLRGGDFFIFEVKTTQLIPIK